MSKLSEVQNAVQDDSSVSKVRRKGSELRVFMKDGSVPEFEVRVEGDGQVHVIERDANGRVGGVLFDDAAEAAAHITAI